jgi:hypothetical protein
VIGHSISNALSSDHEQSNDASDINLSESETAMTKSRTARRASKSSKIVAPQEVETPAFVPTVAETQVLETVELAETIVAEQPAPAPVIRAKSEKWAATVAQAQKAFALKGFRADSNRAVLLPLLDREEGVSLAEAAAAVKHDRKQSTIATDFNDVATITKRHLVRCDRQIGETIERRWKLGSHNPKWDVEG